MEIEDEIELANIAKIFIQNFHKRMDEFKHDKFIVVFVHDRDKVETGVALIYNLVVLIVDEVAHLGLPCNHQLIHLYSCIPYFFEKSLLFHLRQVRRVPLGQPGSAVPTDQKEAVDHISFEIC